MDRSNAYVDRISRGFLRKQAGSHKCFGDIFDNLSKVEKREIAQKTKPSLGRVGIAGDRFVQDNLRCPQFVLVPLTVPPVMRYLLTRCLNQVTAGPSRQIARYGRFNVNAL